jgi:hypothetical protein
MVRRINASAPDLSTPEGRLAARQAKAQPKAAAKPTVEEPVTLQEIHATHTGETEEDLLTRAQAAFDALAAKLGAASPARYLCAAILAIAAALGLGYVIGNLAVYLMVAVALATGSTILVYLIGVITMIVAFVAGYKLSGLVFDYVVTKKVDAHYNKCKSIVTGFFSRKPAPVVAA